jgi:deazaflavin-dependent oxidoreductase (nitroreductase family)
VAARRLALSDESPDAIGQELARWGKVAIIRTRGRVTGRPATAAVGFVEQPDSSLLVAAGAQDADWALNLRAELTCSASIGDTTAVYSASELSGTERNSAVMQLILKYGTPAERLGRGPAYRLVPLAGEMTR